MQTKCHAYFYTNNILQKTTITTNTVIRLQLLRNKPRFLYENSEYSGILYENCEYSGILYLFLSLYRYIVQMAREGSKLQGCTQQYKQIQKNFLTYSFECYMEGGIEANVFFRKNIFSTLLAKKYLEAVKKVSLCCLLYLLYAK